LIAQWNVALPVCGFRNLTGIPCPFCGGTRALQSVAEFDLWAAVQYNPLVLLAGALIVGWALLGALDRVAGTQLVKRLNRRTRKLPVAFIVIGSILLNWVYLTCLLE
jgi:hypothetical protein